MSCCSNGGSRREDEECFGICSECGEELDANGEAYDCCSYSPVTCEKCNWRSCDGSC